VTSPGSEKVKVSPGSDKRNASSGNLEDVGPRVKILNERATLFKITSNAMINACTEYLELTQTQGRKWQRLLSHEREQRLRLEEMVEQLARQHSQLEHQCKKTTVNLTNHQTEAASSRLSASGGGNSLHRRQGSGVSQNSGTTAASQDSVATAVVADTVKDNNKSSAVASISNSDEDEDDDFHDAVADPTYEYSIVSCPPPAHKRSGSNVSTISTKSEGGVEEEEFSSDQEDINTITIVKKVDKDLPGGRNGEILDGTPIKKKMVGRARRTKVPEKPDISFSLWGIMKNCIGKDLSKIPVPVNFSEPLSMLQRLAEDFEYSDILDKAAAMEDDYEQMAYVAAFTVSSYANTAIRAGKPFNPLLGETYEMDRTEDLGWRCVSEQVLHHPPMVAQHCESEAGGWRCWQEFTMSSKFKGKYLEVEPLGITHLEFKRSGNHYTWRKVKTVVHNIVIGKLWIDQHGEMEVVNHKTMDKCYMKFEPYSYFGGTPKKVTGTITSKDQKVEWVLNGTWDNKMEGSKVIGEAIVKGKSSLEIGASKLLWKKTPNDPGAEKYYNFSRFACELNELEDNVAPTDTRLRPDQRMMEEGRWDEANQEKVRLEEKQRAVRRMRETEAEMALQEGRDYVGHQPAWYRTVPDSCNGGKLIHEYVGGY